MSKERTPLTIPEVTARAKQLLLDEGIHPATLIAEGDKETIVNVVGSLAPTHEARAQQMFLLGLLLAQVGEVGVLQQAFLVCEGWMRVLDNGELPELPPSQDPKRAEMLVVSRMVIQPPQTETYAYEMRRNKRGKLIGIDETPIVGSSSDHTNSPLLHAFVIGFMESKTKPNNLL